MQNKLTYDIISLNVRGIREQSKRRSIFSYLKDQKSKFCFLQETYSILIRMMKTFGGMNGEVKYSFPMAPGTAKVFAS